MSDTRNFILEFCSITGLSGNFKGKSPGQAAKKVVRKLFKITPRSSEIRFSIRETTNGSAKKTYKYVGTKQTLPVPKIVKRGPVEFEVTTEYFAHKDKK
jgi:hypothetical protein